MTSPTPFNRDISRHIWETRYRAKGETDIQATWQRVAHALALKGCTVFRPNAIIDAILSLSLASPQARYYNLEREAD